MQSLNLNCVVILWYNSRCETIETIPIVHRSRQYYDAVPKPQIPQSIVNYGTIHIRLRFLGLSIQILAKPIETRDIEVPQFLT